MHVWHIWVCMHAQVKEGCQVSSSIIALLSWNHVTGHLLFWKGQWTPRIHSASVLQCWCYRHTQSCSAFTCFWVFTLWSSCLQDKHSYSLRHLPTHSPSLFPERFLHTAVRHTLSFLFFFLGFMYVHILIMQSKPPSNSQSINFLNAGILPCTTKFFEDESDDRALKRLTISLSYRTETSSYFFSFNICTFSGLPSTWNLYTYSFICNWIELKPDSLISEKPAVSVTPERHTSPRREVTRDLLFIILLFPIRKF